MAVLTNVSRLYRLLIPRLRAVSRLRAVLRWYRLAANILWHLANSGYPPVLVRGLPYTSVSTTQRGDISETSKHDQHAILSTPPICTVASLTHHICTQMLVADTNDKDSLNARGSTFTRRCASCLPSPIFVHFWLPSLLDHLLFLFHSRLLSHFVRYPFSRSQYLAL